MNRTPLGPLLMIVAGILLFLAVIVSVVSDAEMQASELNVAEKTLKALMPR